MYFNVEECTEDFDIISFTCDEGYKLNFDDEIFEFSINCCIARRPKLCKKIKFVKMEQMYSHMRSSQVSVFLDCC